MARAENIAALTAALARHPDGLTAARAAVLIGVPLRTARRYLAELHDEGKVKRVSTYDGTPPVFAWVYTRAA